MPDCGAGKEETYAVLRYFNHLGSYNILRCCASSGITPACKYGVSSAEKASFLKKAPVAPVSERRCQSFRFECGLSATTAFQLGVFAYLTLTLDLCSSARCLAFGCHASRLSFACVVVTLTTNRGKWLSYRNPDLLCGLDPAPQNTKIIGVREDFARISSRISPSILRWWSILPSIFLALGGRLHSSGISDCTEISFVSSTADLTSRENALQH